MKVPLFIKEVRRRSTLPQGHPCSTIDAERLNFRVRNGTGCFPLAMVAETLLSYVNKPCTKDEDMILLSFSWFSTVSREPHSGRVATL